MTTFSILAYDGVEPIDIGATYGVLSMARRVVPDLDFHVAASGGGAVEMANGLIVMAQHALEEAPPADVLMVLGGPGWEAACEDAAMLAHIRRQPERTILASVCTGGMILAAAGVLDGRQATTRDQILPGEARPLDLLAQRYPAVSTETARLIDEGRIVTGGGVSLGIDMTLYLLGRLHGTDVRDEISRILEYGAAYQANGARLPDLVAG